MSSTDNDFKSYMRSGCEHGYAMRTNCPRCKSTIFSTLGIVGNAVRWGAPKAPRKRSAYEPR